MHVSVCKEKLAPPCGALQYDAIMIIFFPNKMLCFFLPVILYMYQS